MKELTGKLAKNIDKIIQQIKESIIYIGLSLFISSIFYYIALGINNITKYLLKSMGFKPKVITYPRKEKDEDILGI
jgi:membrane protein required for beta-lactamase induction